MGREGGDVLMGGPEPIPSPGSGLREVIVKAMKEIVERDDNDPQDRIAAAQLLLKLGVV